MSDIEAQRIAARIDTVLDILVLAITTRPSITLKY